jgi:hypothetical protein
MRGTPVGEEVAMPEGEKVDVRSVAADETGRRIFVAAGDAIPEGYKLEGEAPLAPTPAPPSASDEDDDSEGKAKDAPANKSKVITSTAKK